jgi:hypothetical protein
MMKSSKPKVDLWGELFPMLSENELAELRIRDNDSAKQKAKRGKRHLGSREPEQKAKEINASDGLRRGYPAIRNGKEVRVRTEALTDRELLQNEKRIREEGEAMLRHADRLRAYFERRRRN